MPSVSAPTQISPTQDSPASQEEPLWQPQFRVPSSQASVSPLLSPVFTCGPQPRATPTTIRSAFDSLIVLSMPENARKRSYLSSVLGRFGLSGAAVHANVSESRSDRVGVGLVCADSPSLLPARAPVPNGCVILLREVFRRIDRHETVDSRSSLDVGGAWALRL